MDADGSGGISREELRDFLDTLHLQQVIPDKLAQVEMNAIWKALAGENNEVHMEDLAKYFFMGMYRTKNESALARW